MKVIFLLFFLMCVLHMGVNHVYGEFKVLAVKTATTIVGGGGERIVPGAILKSGTTVKTGPTGQMVAQYKNTFNIFQLTSNTTVKFGVGNITKVAEVMKRLMYYPVSWTYGASKSRPTFLLTQAGQNQANVNGILFEVQSGGVMFNVELEGSDLGGFQANTSLGQGVFNPEQSSKIMIYHQKGEGNPAPQVPGARMGEFTSYIIPKNDDAKLDVVGKNTVINTKIDEEAAKAAKDNRADELFAAFKDGAGNDIKPAGNLLYLEYMEDFIAPDFKDFDGKVTAVETGGVVDLPPVVPDVDPGVDTTTEVPNPPPPPPPPASP